uniref:PLD phosphodiesterase domain-containing protein n=1 Tax=Oryzias melastigma TaxID=30732 RepID=A0A3B3C051_ORYME
MKGPTGGHDLKIQGSGFGFPIAGLPASSIITAVQQQDYSAGVWLRRRDKLEHSQQKCIVIFALVCCFAVLVALIFSAVDIWGEDEDGITEENCSRDCSAVLVENIPDDVSFLDNDTSHLPLSVGLQNLLDRAVRVVEIVSPDWLLNSSDYESSFHPSAKQVKPKLTSRNCNLKSIRRNWVLTGKVWRPLVVKKPDRDPISPTLKMNGMTRLRLSSLQRKELGVLVFNCSCLALDLHRLFSLYWGLEYKEFIPSFWSKRLFALFNRNAPLNLTLNRTKMTAYISSSPDVFIPKDRSSDLEAISRVIQEARRFIYISITDYLPLNANDAQRYWSRIDGLVREALILRGVRVRLLISCWEKTHPLTMNFIWSLKSLCMEQANCSLEAKFFNPRVQRDDSLEGINHNRFMVTDKAIYLGNLDWVGKEFTFNAGAGLVISHPDDIEERNFTVVEQLQAVFERDWFSSHTHPVQTDSVLSTQDSKW